VTLVAGTAWPHPLDSSDVMLARPEPRRGRSAAEWRGPRTRSRSGPNEHAPTPITVTAICRPR
jgi:hypothetical protein